MKNRNTFFVVFLCLLVLALGLTWPAGSATAAPQAQGFVTATPGPDGRILYTVVANDNCSSVAFQHGITVQQLQQFNSRLDANCTLTIGQTLVVGFAQPESNATAGPSPTPGQPTPTATPFNGTTEVCVLLFDDVNGDALRQETEFGIDGGAVSLTNLNGSFSETVNTTSAIDPDLLEPVRVCYPDVPAGEYNVSMAVPDGYNPTTLLSYRLTVNPGDRALLVFGAQSQTAPVEEQVEQEGGSRSSVLGLAGLALLLAGVGLGYYAYRANQPASKLKGTPLDRDR